MLKIMKNSIKVKRNFFIQLVLFNHPLLPDYDGDKTYTNTDTKWQPFNI